MVYKICKCLFVFSATAPQWVMASSFLMFLDHTQRRSTFGRTPLDERSARRRDLYLTTHDTHNRQTSMPPVGFEPTVSAGERPQTYALDRAATGTGKKIRIKYVITITSSSTYSLNFVIRVPAAFFYWDFNFIFHKLLAEVDTRNLLLPTGFIVSATGSHSECHWFT